MGRSRASKEQMGMSTGVVPEARGRSYDTGNLPKSMSSVSKKKEDLEIRKKSEKS